MSTAQMPDHIPDQYRIALAVFLVVTLAYAILTGHILLWVFSILAMVSLGISLFALYLFYRLVLAVEQIAYGP